MRQEARKSLERQVSARFGVPAPTLYSRTGQSPGIVMSRLRCDHHGHGRSQPVEPEDAYVLHVMLRDVERYGLQFGGARAVSAPAARGSVFVGAMKDLPVARLDTPFDLMRIYVTRAALDDRGGASGPRRPVNLQLPHQGTPNPLLSSLVRAVLPVFGQAFDQGQMFVDSISLAIRDHLVAAYGGEQDDPRAAIGGLPPWLERRAKDFIDSTLAEGSSLAEVAAHCGLSPSHFSKAFRASTGRPPHRWLLERRVDRAMSLLKEDGLTLADIARRCGFSDASHFSRTFSQLIREPPAAWRRRNRGG